MKVYDGRHDKKILPTKHTVTVISANRIDCGDSDHMTIRKNGRVDWSLFYCEQGRIFCENSVLGAGQAWIYPPGAPQKYTTRKKDKTIYRYLHFTGSDVAALLDSLAIRPFVAIDVKSRSVPDLFDRIQTSLAEGSALSEVSAEYHTLHLISKLAKSYDRFSDLHRMKRVTDNMEHSFAFAYDASRYADMLGMSVSRFNHLFKQYVGLSPYAYYMNLRMANACSLLEDTDLPVKDIAQTCGYQDAMYFTQAFKKNKGITPSAYRKRNKASF